MDLLIQNATIVDGTGGPARLGDVSVSGGRILAMGEAFSLPTENCERILEIAKFHSKIRILPR